MRSKRRGNRKKGMQRWKQMIIEKKRKIRKRVRKVT